MHLYTEFNSLKKKKCKILLIPYYKNKNMYLTVQCVDAEYLP